MGCKKSLEKYQVDLAEGEDQRVSLVTDLTRQEILEEVLDCLDTGILTRITRQPCKP
jgi:hypothetical protein